MHGAAGDNTPSYRYAAAPRNSNIDEQHHQPSTSSNSTITHMHHLQPMTIMRTPTSSSGGGVSRPAPSLVRIGQPIKVGDSILQPAGTLVFSPHGDGPAWSTGQKVVIRNHNNVVQANFLPIGMTLQSANGSWFLNQQPISTTATSSSSISNPNTTSSATPDSGIQSVPTSPPSPRYELTNERDDVEIIDDDEDDGPADFTDMPCLKPADEDDCYDVPSTSSGPPVVEPTSVTPIPPSSREDLNSMNPDELFAISIEKNMDLDEIVQRLMRFHSEKASDIAALIKKKCAEETKKKKDMEAEVSSTTPSTPARVTRKRTRVARNTNSPDVTTSTTDDPPPACSPVEEGEPKAKAPGKKRGRKPKKKFWWKLTKDEQEAKRLKREEVPSTSSTPGIPSIPREPTPSEMAEKVLFRLMVRQQTERQLEEFVDKMAGEMDNLRVGKVGGKRKDSFIRQLDEQSKKIKKGLVCLKRMKMFEETKSCKRFKEEKKEPKQEEVEEVKEEDDDECPKVRSRLHSTRRSRVEESEESNFAVEEKYNGEYYEIPKSIPSSETVIPLWRAPSLTCGCTKGACTSDMDCLNRALRVQCNSECTLSYCSNRRFWKEDNNKLCISNGPRSRRVLKTKVARRAGEFLGEFAGEVIMGEEAVRRFKEHPDSRIIAISSQLFVDATTRGNVVRFVKHSCKPNSRLEVWSVNGLYRAGVFALVDLATNIEITVDKSGLIPTDQPCNCGASGCKKVIRGVRAMKMVGGDAAERIETRRFLQRNKRRTIERARRASGLPAILTAPEGSSEPTKLIKMKKMLAAFAFRVRRIDGTMPRSLLPFYTNICKFLKTARDPKPAEFIHLFRVWLDQIDDDDLERAFVAIESHYLSSSLMDSSRTKKLKENAPRARAASTSSSSHSPVPSGRRGDADLSYLNSSYLINSYDPDVAWESYHAKANDNAVRCVCGALDEDGEMVQCDKCDFWLHMDCVQFKPVDQEEYKCDFCLGRQPGNRPNADVKITIPLDVRFEHCDYYRSLVNRRGMQIRLNETVYVGKTLPDEHKAMLRNLKEEKKGAKPLKAPSKSLFPDAPTEPLPLLKVERKEARIFRVERLFVCPGNNRFVFGSFYAWPHETYADTGRQFSKREVFATPYYETLPIDEVIGRCLVVDTCTWSKGRPKVPLYKEDDVYFCEMHIGKHQRVFEKVNNKNRYPINTQPYVFTNFSHPKKIVRDFRPYDQASNPSPKPTLPLANPFPLSKINWKKMSRKNIDRIAKRLGAAAAPL